MKKVFVGLVAACMLMASSAFALSYSSNAVFEDYPGMNPNLQFANPNYGKSVSEYVVFTDLTLDIAGLAPGYSYQVVFGHNGDVPYSFPPSTLPFTLPSDALGKVNICLTGGEKCDNVLDDTFRVRFYGNGQTNPTITSATLTGHTTAAVTPEPATMLLMAAGLAGLPVVRRLRKKSMTE